MPPDKKITAATVNSQQLNGMSESQLMAYRLMIVPVGNYITIGNSLTPDTTTNIHNAVQGGLNYLRICAGGLLAGNATCNSLNLTSGAVAWANALVGYKITQKEGLSDDEVHLHIHATPSAEGLHSGKAIVIMKKVGNEWKQDGDL